MRSLLFFSNIIGLACAAPRPQDIDLSLAEALPEPTYSEAVSVAAQVVTYNISTVLSSATARITASMVDTAVAVVHTTDAAPNQNRDACAAYNTPDNVQGQYCVSASFVKIFSGEYRI